MRSLLLLVLSALVAAAQDMNICVLNRDKLPEHTVERATTETEFVFAAAGIGISWTGCDDSTGGRTLFVRLRGGKPPKTAGPASLEAMGAAIVSRKGDGYLVDAYFRAVQALATRYETDADRLLGYVIAHELGHILLGAGHTPDGIMGPIWTTKEVNGLRHRWLRFDEGQRKRMLLKLRTQRPDSAHNRE
jgi:hypothetical protein